MKSDEVGTKSFFSIFSVSGIRTLDAYDVNSPLQLLMLQKWKGKLQCHRFYMKWFHGPVQLPDHHSDARRGWQPYKNMFPRDLQILCWTQLVELLALLPCVNESRIVIIVMAPNFDKKVMGESCPLGHPRWSKKEKRKLGPKSRPKSGLRRRSLNP